MVSDFFVGYNDHFIPGYLTQVVRYCLLRLLDQFFLVLCLLIFNGFDVCSSQSTGEWLDVDYGYEEGLVRFCDRSRTCTITNYPLSLYKPGDFRY